VKLPTVRIGQRLDEVVLDCLEDQALLREGDIVAVVSKVVSTCENRMLNLDEIRVTIKARRLSRRWRVDQRLAAIVLEEADQVLGGVEGFLLTVKNEILTANAGIDLKNCPPGTAILWPKNADRSAAILRKRREKRYSARLGVIVVDSRVTAMRLGTVGLAIGVSGLTPVIDYRGASDIYGRKTKITQTNVADDLASSAHLLMGEADERIGVVIARGVPVSLPDVGGSRTARLNAARCLIGKNIASARKLS
jgi:coenzyme F420-0:L-glutamate ligase